MSDAPRHWPYPVGLRLAGRRVVVVGVGVAEAAVALVRPLCVAGSGAGVRIAGVVVVGVVVRGP